jgi:hypothetical protein
MFERLARQDRQGENDLTILYRVRYISAR